MPKIPVYDSQVSSPVPQPQQVNTDLFTSGGEQIRKVANEIDQINQQLTKVRDYKESTSASLDLQRKIKEIELEASNDPDPNNIVPYKQRLQQTIDETSGMITSAEARAEFSARAKTMALDSEFSILSMQQRKLAEQALGESIRAHANIDSYAMTGTDENGNPVNMEALIQAKEYLLQQDQEKGIRTAADVEKMRAAYPQVWKKNRINHTEASLQDEIYNNPAAALNKLSDPKLQEDLGAKKVSEMKELARDNFERIALDESRDRMIGSMSRNDERMQLWESGDPELLSILFEQEQDLLLRGTSEDLAEVENIRAMRNSILKRKPVSPDQQNKNYNDFYDQIDNLMKDKMKMADYLRLQTKIMESGFSGQVDDSQYKSLLKVLSNDFRERGLIKEANGTWFMIPAHLVPGKSTYDRAFRIINSYLKEEGLDNRTTEKANILRNMFRFVDSRKITDIEDDFEMKKALDQAVANSLGLEIGGKYSIDGMDLIFNGFNENGERDFDRVK